MDEPVLCNYGSTYNYEYDTCTATKRLILSLLISLALGLALGQYPWPIRTLDPDPGQDPDPTEIVDEFGAECGEEFTDYADDCRCLVLRNINTDEEWVELYCDPDQHRCHTGCECEDTY